jgi:transposase-like protein
MPSKIDPAVKARALRMIAEHRGNYSSGTASAVAVAGKVGVGRETVRRWLDLPHPGKAGLPDRRAHLPVLHTGHP